MSENMQFNEVLVEHHLADSLQGRLQGPYASSCARCLRYAADELNGALTGDNAMVTAMHAGNFIQIVEEAERVYGLSRDEIYTTLRGLENFSGADISDDAIERMKHKVVHGISQPVPHH